jgi:hypothetical protein
MERPFPRNIPLFTLVPVFFLLFFGCSSHQNQVLTRRWGFIDKTGNVVIKPQFLQLGDFSEGLAPAQSSASAKWGFIDRQGNFVVQPQYDEVEGFKEGLAAVRVGSKIGYIDKTGNMVIDPIYVSASSFSEGLAEVAPQWSRRGIEAPVGYIDRTGKMVIPPKFWDLPPVDWNHSDRQRETIPFHGDFSEGLAGLILYKDKLGRDHRGYIDRRGNVVLELANAVALGPFREGLAAVAETRKLGFIDRSGKYAIQPTFGRDGMIHPFSEGFAAVTVGGKLGYIDHSGKMIIAPQYDWATNFSGDRALVKNNGADPLYIDKTGRRIFQGFQVHADVFSEGLAAAPIRTWTGLFELFPAIFFSGRPRWGFIDASGKIAIGPQFDDAHSFSEGLAPVAKYIWINPNQ